ncbi:pollen-specific leucine-rich repeat extensin-like protein 1 [Lactuca sativa]|uniref:pollen-specific leucine-rich repeat extensin-like protein 1 n=1 Tax=Lactuca sativa TaxID=4236 RepID=UPI0022AFDA12|nr:pollen-specific leucine-rich repeat extensin-like protein 1 [Lactuca sativa]
MADYNKLHSIEPRVLTPEQQAVLDALDQPSGRGKRVCVKKETTEAKTSKPSKSKKQKTETESSSKPKKIKRMARKPKGPTPPPSDDEDDQEADSPHESPRGKTPPRSPSPIPEDKIPTPPPSPKQFPPKPETVKIPTPTPPPPPSPKPTPPKQPTPTPTPEIPVLVVLTVGVNVSHTGAPTVSETPATPIPPSPTKSTDSGATLGVDNDEYDSTHFSPYRLQLDEDTEGPINRQHLDSIHEKLDKLLADTKAYGGVVLKAFVEAAIEQYTKAMEKSTEAVNEYTSLGKKATTDIAEVVRTTQIFLDSLKGHADTNAAQVRASVDSLSQALKEEHLKFEDVCSSLKANNASLISLVSSKLDSMHAEIAKESALKE